MALVLLLLLLGVVVGGVRGKLVDLSPYQQLILDEHNDLRVNVIPPAADMRQIVWDDNLTQSAQEWAEYCRYERPPGYMYNSGANLAYQRYHVNANRPRSVRSNVLQGLESWSREREFFKYGTDCGMACSYAQIIYSLSYRVGCAMNTCSRLRVGHEMESYSTLFLCFYAPQGRVMSSFPYHKGNTCSQCPSHTFCNQGLCAEAAMKDTAALMASDGAVVSLYGPAAPLMSSSSAHGDDGPGVSLYGPAALRLPNDDAQASGSEVALSSAPRQRSAVSTDELTDSEASFLLQVQNMFRQEDGHKEMQWDSGLQQWSDWIVSCEADYPGPPHTFTNFHRLSENTPIYEVVYEWRKEGKDPNIQMQKGCRTPYDHTECNHYTNMMQSSVNAVACSARNCQDGSRQLVCLYDTPSSFRQP